MEAQGTLDLGPIRKQQDLLTFIFMSIELSSASHIVSSLSVEVH